MASWMQKRLRYTRSLISAVAEIAEHTVIVKDVLDGPLSPFLR